MSQFAPQPGMSAAPFWRRRDATLLVLALGLGAFRPGPVVAGPDASVTVREGVALIGPEDLVPDPATGLRRIRLAFPERPSRRRLAAARPDTSREGQALARLVARGAAGNHRDLYDNRDRGHSALQRERFPTLSVTQWTDAARSAGLDYGPNPGIVFDAITVGNSSTARTGDALWRSHGRAAMTEPGSMARLAVLAGNNQLYVYPAHNDVSVGRGDLLPANHIYTLSSLGSSGSDQPLLRAVTMILAAFRPETKAHLRKHGLVVPTVQMILRQGQTGVDGPEAYLSGAAHPTAFAGDNLDIVRMLDHANRLRPEDIPPMPRLRVLDEPVPLPGLGLFGDGLGERLFDTPWAAARVAVGVEGVRRYRLSVADTVDPGDRPLRILWRVLRGSGATVTPDGDDGLTATVQVPWTAPYPAPGSPARQTLRVDVAAFAVAGEEISAPAIFSVAFPPTEVRRYAPDGRPLEIRYAPVDPGPDAPRGTAAPDFAAPFEAGGPGYADPVLFMRRNWTDRYAYAEDGSLLGWTRIAPDGRETRFTRHGLRVTVTDAAGRPAEAEAIGYPLERRPLGRVEVLQRATGQRYAYRYAGPQDRLGEVAAVP